MSENDESLIYKNLSSDNIEKNSKNNLLNDKILSCSELNYSIKKNKILKGIDFYAESGSLFAIVGPCGAGKTTVLNCLARRTKGGIISGQVTLNGISYTNEEFKSLCSYVMTNGRLLPYLTVYETIKLAATLKLPLSSEKEKNKRVEAVLTELGLQECRDTYIAGEWKKGISTGERKRVCIAIELLDDPLVLILDEPTSGLDSKLACGLLSTLRKIAMTGRVVILSINQPTSQMWSLLDRLLLLSQGSTVFYGNTNEAKEYFEKSGYICPKNYNPGDFVLELISSNTMISNYSKKNSSDNIKIIDMENNPEKKNIADVNNLIKQFKISNENIELKKKIGTIVSFKENTILNNKDFINKLKKKNRTKIWFKETKTLCNRSFKNSIRNPIVCCVMLLVQALQGIILGSIFWQISNPISNQKPISIEPSTVIKNEWSQLFMNGINGHQSLLEALEYGVDNRGSQPLIDLYNSNIINNSYEILRCGIDNFDLKSKGYPNFNLDNKKDMNQITPHGLAVAILGAAQIIDYNYDKIEWTRPKGVNLVNFWLELMPQIGKNFYDDFAVCVGGIKLKDSYDQLVNNNNNNDSTNINNNNNNDSTNINNNNNNNNNNNDSTNINNNNNNNDSTSINNNNNNNNDSTNINNNNNDSTNINNNNNNNNDSTNINNNNNETTNIINNNNESTNINNNNNETTNINNNNNETTNINNNNNETTNINNNKRQLITLEDTGFKESTFNLIGTDTQFIINAFKDILQYIESCNHERCKWINDQLNTTVKYSDDFYIAGMTLANVLGALFFAVANLGFATYDALLTFPQERVLLNRETANGLYKVSSYFVGKNISDLSFQIFPSFVLVTIFYLAVGLGGSFKHYLIYLIICTGITFASYGFGYFISAISPRMEIAVLIAPVILVIWLTVAGFFLREEQIPIWISWFGYLSFYKWGFFSLVLNQFPIGQSFGIIPHRVALVISGIPTNNIVITITILYTLGFLYRFLAYFALKYTNRSVGLKN